MNKQLTTSLLASCLSLLATVAQAQTTFSIGPHVGLNVAGTTNRSPGNTTIRYRTGFEAGLQSVVQFDRWAVQPSLQFSQKGFNEHQGDGLYSRYTDYRLNYLTLPVNIAYSLRSDGQGWQVVAGPYVAMLLGGSYQRTSEDRGPWGSTDYSEGDIKPGETYYVPALGTTYYPLLCHRFDAGLQAGLGYRFGKLLAQAEFSFGLRDLAPQFASTYNRAAQLSLSYLVTPSR